MLVGRDLGLPYLVVLVVVVVIVPAIGFVIRGKWRHAEARREEIKRLLVLASEEAARAELEAREEYYYTGATTASVPSPLPGSAWVPAPDSAWVPAPASVPLVSSSKPPYQCAVCFSPTSTRCAKCKAVRYCSGRCQIVHWRQGHKDECRPYVAVSPAKDVSGKDSSENFGEVGVQSPETISIFQSTSDPSHKGESSFSSPLRSSIEASSNSSRDSDRTDDVTSDNFVKVKPGHQTTLSEEDIQSTFSSSSARTDDGSNESSFSEPSTSSSSFWSGTIHSKKSSVDGFESPSSSGAASVSVSDETTSSSVTKNGHNSTVMNDVLATSTISDKFTASGLGIKTSNDETTSSKETFSAGGHSTFKDSKAFGGMPCASPERPTNVFGNKSIHSPAFESTGVVSSLSKASNAHLTSSSQSTKPMKAHDENHRVHTPFKPTESFQSAKNGLKTSKLKVVDQLKPSKLSRQCSPRGESQTAHRYSCKGLFSYEMFVKLYNWKKVELKPFGLVNCGNSCYANAVLQCLAYTPPLNAYLLEGLHAKACDKKEWCFTCEFEGLVLKGKDGNSPLSPIRILSQLENIGSNLGHGREEDAHEFLRYAIDALQSVCLKEAGTNASNSLEEETTLIGLTFGGYLRSKIKCLKCGGKSERHERMMDLTVEIEGNIGTLEEALNKFTCMEILDGENKYKCGRCKSYEKAKKKLTILEAPNVLTIALKRFQSGKFGKLNKPINFPEILDMAPYVSGTSDKSPVYRLYGVVVHVDVMNAAFSGHYVCYVKNVQNRWFKIDDSRVKEVDLRSVLTKGAYMLLYARCSPRAPRLIRSLLMRHHHDPRKHKAATPFMSRSQATEPWDVCGDRLTSQPLLRHRTLEEESSSSSDNSGFFSESCSCSTESSHLDSSSIEDHISWDWDHDGGGSPSWLNLNRNSNSSDSDTSSTSSFPSPFYSIHSRRGGKATAAASAAGVLYHEDDQCRKLSCSNSCRETNVDRLGGRPTKPLGISKPSLR